MAARVDVDGRRPGLRGHPPDQGGPAGDNGGTFAFDGLEAAARRARDAAGDKDVLVLGAHVAGQLLRAALLDEVRIHLVPLLLGEGTPLFAGDRAELLPEGNPSRGP
jgi:dihydrofolate reductase